MITSAVPCRLMRFGRGTLFRRAWMAEIPFEEGALTMFEAHRLTGHSIGMTFTSGCSVLARLTALIDWGQNFAIQDEPELLLAR